MAELQARPDIDPRLQPYILRAEGLQLQGQQQYVDAMEKLTVALKAFDGELRRVGQVTLFQPENDLRAERAYTLIDLGRATSTWPTRSGASGPGRCPGRVGLWARAAFALLTSLPLVIYLAVYLGRAVWRPSFWATLPGLDWIIARLYAVGARYYRRADADLERYGQPAEATVADEGLAALYLALGPCARSGALVIGHSPKRAPP